MTHGEKLGLIAAFAAIYLFWGGTFLALRVAVQEVPPMTTIALRCAGGAALLGAWCGLRGTLVRPTAAEWRSAAAAAGWLFLGSHALLAWAEQRVPSGQAALLLSTIPMWFVVLEASKHGYRPSLRVLIGLFVGTAGVAVLSGGDGAWKGTGLDRAAILAGGFAWAAGSLVARNGARPSSAVQSTAMQLAAGAVVVAVAGLAAGEWRALPSTVTPQGLTALGFLIVCGTTVGFAAYTWLLRVTTPVAVGTYAFVNPVIALALAWAVGDEPASRRTAIAAALIIGAVWLVGAPLTRGRT